MSDKSLLHRWRVALLGWAVVLAIPAILPLPHPESFILVIVLVVLTTWLIGRLRNSR
jgi:hypothetical protein